MIIRKYSLGDIYNLTPQKAQIHQYAKALDKDKYLSETNTTVLLHNSVIIAIGNVNEDKQLFSLLLSKYAKSKIINVFRCCLKETQKQSRENFKMLVRDKFKQGDRLANMLSFKKTDAFIIKDAVTYNIYQRCK